MSFTVYKSSAGSGKTYTLVKAYLKIVLLKPSDFRSILAITFTNKAANEMKERVISNLKELIEADQNKESKTLKYLLPELISETGLSAEEISKNANKSLALILHNYSDFAISTIDSFVHKIIKTFAYDLKLPLNFDVELDANKLLNEAINTLISKVGSDQAITDLLVRFTHLKADEERDWHIENDLLNLSETLFKEEGIDYVSFLKDLSFDDFKEIVKQINTFIKQFKNEINLQAENALKLIDSNQIDYSSFFQGKRGLIGMFLKFSRSSNLDFLPNKNAIKTIEEDKWYSSKISQDQKHAIDTIRTDLVSYYRNIEIALEKGFEKFMLFSMLSKQIYPLAVLNEIEHIISDIKTQKNIVHISEFNKKISEIVFTEPVPFIYERLGEKYKHYLVDEFQDTSILQWQNLIPLIDNSLAEGNFNMIVGDGKQAIYRWRSGEVEQFDKLPKIYAKQNLAFANEREENLIRNYKPETLNNNFRSKKEIVEFNNAFFSFLSGSLNDNFKGVYADTVQNFDERNSGGYVQLEFVPKDDSNSEKDPILERLLSLINEITQSGRAYNEIVLLCRTRKEAEKCSNILLKNNIPVISSESLLLSSSPEVNLLVSFLHVLTNPSDKIYLASVIQYFINKGEFSQGDFIELLNNNNNNQFDLEKLRKYFDEKGMSFSYEEYISLPIYDLLEKAIRTFKLNTIVDPYIQFFMDEVLKLSSKGVSNITELLDWWELEKDKISVIIPEGVNSIQLMTIHKSKGLEFPIVIYPYANEKHKAGLNQVWVPIAENEISKLKVSNLPITKNLLDTKYKALYEYEMNKSLLDLINLSYVAFTRAVDQLYVISNYPTASKSAHTKPTDTIDLPKMMKSFLEYNKMWDPELTTYTFGEAISKKSDSAKLNQAYILKEFNSVEWRDNLMISTSAPEYWDMENPQQNKVWGNLVHLLLSQIISIEDVDLILEHSIQKGLLEDVDKEELSKTLFQIVSHPDLESYFIKGIEVKTESDILLENGLTIRPDRLIIGDDKLTIIDYKTGLPSKNHRNQLEKYAKILRSMGHNLIEKVLVYINDELKVEKWI